MLDKYGWRVTPPSQPTGAQRETLLIEVRGVGFGKIAVDFLAFLRASLRHQLDSCLIIYRIPARI
jgi:hypothetical protein